MRNAVLVFTFLFSLSAFAKLDVNPDNKIEVKGLMTMSVACVKDKSKKFDVSVTASNVLGIAAIPSCVV